MYIMFNYISYLVFKYIDKFVIDQQNEFEKHKGGAFKKMLLVESKTYYMNPQNNIICYKQITCFQKF